MQEKIKEIATRIKELREISNISVEEMASRLNIDAATYRNYEAGETDIPASILYEISNELKVDMSVLLKGEDPRMHIFTVTRKDRGIAVERRKEYKYQSLAANFVHKKAEPFVVKVEPKPEGTQISMNSHPGQEFDFVLEGSLKVVIYNNEIVLEEGDSIFFDSNYPHGMAAVGGKSAKFLAVIM
ncbi:MAG: cupin domain-containing protein [Methanomethylovorans sp.]|jgi:transcriptional regulator with XRE-family HTH domain|nr:cupin domain-containing protein [Methanomethylovorans sp.]